MIQDEKEWERIKEPFGLPNPELILRICCRCERKVETLNCQEKYICGYCWNESDFEQLFNEEKMSTATFSKMGPSNLKPEICFSNEIGMVLTIKNDGTIEIGKKYTPTQASDEFLDILKKTLPNCIRDIEKAAVDKYRRKILK